MGSRRGSGIPTFIDGVSKISNATELKKKTKDARQSLICICFLNDSEPCRKIASKFDELTEKFKEVVFLLGLVDECVDVVQAFSLTMVPTFILIQNMIILEIFVGSSYYRLLRRIEMRLIDDEEDRDYKELSRISKTCHDNVYVIKSSKVDHKGRASGRSVDLLGLRYATSGPTWKDRTKMFVEACEKVRHSTDFMSYLYDPQESEDSLNEARVASNRSQRKMNESFEEMKARRVSFGEQFELGRLRKDKQSSRRSRHVHSSTSDPSQPLLQGSSRPLPTLDDTAPTQTSDVDMSMYSDLRQTIITQDIQQLQEQVVDLEKCTVDPNLLAVEDRDYTKDEVAGMINKCMKMCWVAKKNKEFDVHSSIPPTVDFGENLTDILSSSEDENKEDD